MPSTIIKALRALSLPSEIPLLEILGCSRDIFRIMNLETISSTEVTPAELEAAQQGLLFNVLLILLHAGTLRKQTELASTRMAEEQERLQQVFQKSPGTDERRIGREAEGPPR